jgi:cation diffusion facilitator family transporter
MLRKRFHGILVLVGNNNNKTRINTTLVVLSHYSTTTKPSTSPPSFSSSSYYPSILQPKLLSYSNTNKNSINKTLSLFTPLLSFPTVAAAAAATTSNKKHPHKLSFSSSALPLPNDDEKELSRRAAAERHHKFEQAEDRAEKQALTQSVYSWTAVSRALAGNSIISLLKFLVFMQTGSAAILSEAVHSLADCGNQALLLKGLHDASQTPDKRHPYGYGRSGFFWGLVSALGMFWMGAGVTISHGGYQLLHPSTEIFEVSNEMIFVLISSFLMDGYVFTKTLQEVNYEAKKKGVSLRYHLLHDGVRDPFVMTVLFEDAAACVGVTMAAAGIFLTHYYQNVAFDTLACLGVGTLLATVAWKLVRINQRYLLGTSIDDEIVSDIKSMLSSRRAISAVYDVQTQWISPNAFSFKAECDFDGLALSERLYDGYIDLFRDAIAKNSESDIRTVMHWFAEDVTRLIELEVKEVETIIRSKYPSAAFIELEPDSKKSFVRKSDGRAWLLDRMSRDIVDVEKRLERKMSLNQQQQLQHQQSMLSSTSSSSTSSSSSASSNRNHTSNNSTRT